MKQRIMLFILVTLAFAQCWASPIDSLRIKPNTPDLTDKLNDLEFSDGRVNPNSVRDLDGLTFIDYITPGGTAETTSSSNRYIKVTKVQEGIFDSYDATWYTPGGDYCGDRVSLTFDVETYNINKYTLQISGTGSSMFSLDKYSVTGGSGKVKRTLTLSYRLTTPGIHQVYIIIKEKNPGFLRIPKKYKLRVMCATRMYYSNTIPNPYDDEDINSTDDALEMPCFSTCGEDELAADVKIYAEGQNVIIESAVEQSAVICDVTGRARTVNLKAGRNEIPVNASGLYIVRTREKTAKLMLK